MSSRVLFTTASVILLAGCGAVHLRPPAEPEIWEGTVRPTPLPPRDGMPTGGGNVSSATIRDICRGHGVPSGWVVTGYRTGGDECPKVGEANAYNIAVIERVAERPRGAVVTMCADQAVPRGWRRDPSVLPTHECTGARVAKDHPTSVTIRRR